MYVSMQQVHYAKKLVLQGFSGFREILVLVLYFSHEKMNTLYLIPYCTSQLALSSQLERSLGMSLQINRNYSCKYVLCR